MSCDANSKPQVAADRLDRAREIAHELKNEAPAMELRELLEAVMGVRAARIQVSQRGLRRVKEIAKRYRFGIAVADYALLARPTSGLGGWADGAGEEVDHAHPEALINVYLGDCPDRAYIAKHAEEHLGDDAFGKVLGIPGCCRNFYSEAARHNLVSGLLFNWLSVASQPQNISVPFGANFLGRYFGASLVSHFPCALNCSATRRQTEERFSILREVDYDLAEKLIATHRWNYLVIKGTTIVAYMKATSCGDGLSFELADQVVLDHRGEMPRWNRVSICDDRLVFRTFDGSAVEFELGEARFVRPNGEW